MQESGVKRKFKMTQKDNSAQQQTDNKLLQKDTTATPTNMLTNMEPPA